MRFRGPARDYARLTQASGTMTDPQAQPGLIAAWGFVQLAPWLLGAATLWFLVPTLRGSYHGEPFRRSVSRRMASVGGLLLVAVPSLALFEWMVAEAASGGNGVSPAVEPSATFSILHFLPGLLLLVLARIFHKGADLQDLERHTV